MLTDTVFVGEFSVLVRLQRESLENTKRLESKIDKIGTALSDLKKIVEENEKKNFSIKECGYEVRSYMQQLNSSITGQIFCRVNCVVLWQNYSAHQ